MNNNNNSTLYNSNSLNMKKNPKTNNISNNINIYNSTLLKTKNVINKSNSNINSQNNLMSLLPNGYLGGYQTFFTKNKSSSNAVYSNYQNKYNYNINTNYFKDELKKYNKHAGSSNDNRNGNPSYYNIIDENDEYENNNSDMLNNSNGAINKKIISDTKKINNKLVTKYGEGYGNSNNLYNNIKNKGMGKNQERKTMYNYGGGFGKKKVSCQLPQLFKDQNINNNDLQKSHYLNHFGIKKKKYN